MVFNIVKMIMKDVKVVQKEGYSNDFPNKHKITFQYGIPGNVSQAISAMGATELSKTK